MFMTEEQIERRVEHMIDILDRMFMAGRMEQAAYDAEIRRINAWADREYLTAKE
jgi:hypothetical protein